MLDEVEVNNFITKLRYYRDEEQINEDSLKTTFKNINNCYKSGNQNKLNLKVKDILLKYEYLINVHSDDLIAINDVLIKYIETSKKAESILEDIYHG